MNNLLSKKIPVLAAVLFGTLAFATGPSYAAGDMSMERTKVDLNGDGMISENEIMTYVKMFFLKMDKNNDHMVDKDEWGNLNP